MLATDGQTRYNGKEGNLADDVFEKNGFMRRCRLRDMPFRVLVDKDSAGGHDAGAAV